MVHFINLNSTAAGINAVCSILFLLDIYINFLVLSHL